MELRHHNIVVFGLLLYSLLYPVGGNNHDHGACAILLNEVYFRKDGTDSFAELGKFCPEKVSPRTQELKSLNNYFLAILEASGNELRVQSVIDLKGKQLVTVMPRQPDMPIQAQTTGSLRKFY
jgi:hypothetical protein